MRKAPIEALMQTPVSQTVDFLAGTNAIRTLLSATNAEGGYVIAPLRGAMPIACAAQGDQETEITPSSLRKVAPLPIGLFEYTNRQGADKTKSPSHAQKREVIRNYLASIMPSESRLYLLDEVQKGGTMSQAAKIIRQQLNQMDERLILRIIAAQDSRVRVVREAKKPEYTTMIGNNTPGIIANVISLPLIATDRSDLLDRVVLKDGRAHETHNIGQRLEVINHTLAQRVFRILGSMARNPDVRNDQQYQWDMLNEQCNDLPEATSARAETWLARVVGTLNSGTRNTHSA